MLVLSRDVSQKFIVGSAELTILSVRGNRVRIGIVAAPEIPVRRAKKEASGKPSKTPSGPHSSP